MADWAVLLKPAVRRIIDAMLGGATTLTAIAEATGHSKPALVPQLKALAELGVVHGERIPTSTGSEAHYRLRDVSLHLSIDAARSAAVAWATPGRWDAELSLLAQVPQPEVREEVRRLLLALRDAGQLPRDAVLILFGSAARGEATWKSDIDILVLVEALDPRRERAFDEAAFEAQIGTQHAFSPTFVTRDEWTSNRKRIVQEARAEGIILWGGEEAPWSSMKRYGAIRL